MVALQFHGRSLGCRLPLRISFYVISRARLIGGLRECYGILVDGSSALIFHYGRVAHYNRERIRRGATVDKAVVKKNLGRLTRM